LASIIVFLGAGSSKAFADIPTMKEMVPLFQEEIRSSSSFPLYSDIVDTLKEIHPTGVDLEAVFSVLNGIVQKRTLRDAGSFVAYRVRKAGVPVDQPFADEPNDFKQQLKEKYTKGQEAMELFREFQAFVNSKCEVQQTKEEGLLKLYSRFSDMLPSGAKAYKTRRELKLWYARDWAFYTTNYDLCVETICRQAEITLNRGVRFDQASARNILQPEILDVDEFKIVKLHGSISWYRRADEKMVEYPDGKPTRPSEAGAIKESVMLYPIEEKAMYEEPYVILLNIFRKDLRNAPKWLFIGYSFNDPVLLRIIEYCSDDAKKIAIVHPEASRLLATKLQGVRGSKAVFERKFGDDTLMGELGSFLR